MAMCERSFRVRNHLVGRDASYEEAPYERNRFGGETLRTKRHFMRGAASCIL